jgi:uncharacterized protein (TIGR02996 family)
MTEERAFLLAILEKPDDDALKLVYADWLEEQGDPRAEFLREMVKVRQERSVTPEQRQQYQELAAELANLRSRQRRPWRGSSPEARELQQRVRELESRWVDLSKQIRRPIPARLRQLAANLDPDWLAVVSDPEIEGCGKSIRAGGWLRFEFLCDQSWADMKPTADRKVRHCETCNHSVYFCDNLADAREHARQSHCIAVDLGILRRAGDLEPPRMWLGRVSPETLRRTSEENLDPVSKARLDARKQGGKNSTRRR